MRVYIAPKGKGIEKAVEHNGIEKVRTYTNIFGQEIIALTKTDGKVWSGELLYYDVWII